MKLNIRHLNKPDVISALQKRAAPAWMKEHQKEELFAKMSKCNSSTLDVTEYETCYGKHVAYIVINHLQQKKLAELKGLTSPTSAESEAIDDLEAATDLFKLVKDTVTPQPGLFGRSFAGDTEPPSTSYGYVEPMPGVIGY